jgi:hypothetical protein
LTDTIAKGRRRRAEGRRERQKAEGRGRKGKAEGRRGRQKVKGRGQKGKAEGRRGRQEGKLWYQVVAADRSVEPSYRATAKSIT